MTMLRHASRRYRRVPALVSLSHDSGRGCTVSLLASPHHPQRILNQPPMTPTIGPTPPLPTPGTFTSYHRSLSASSLPAPNVQEVVTAEGVRHADDIVLDARQYKFTSFAQDLLQLLATLRIATWGPSPSLTPLSIKIHKVSGSLTNAVFFVSHPSARTLLLRIYGPSSSSLVSRPHELHTLHVLSSRYGIGPRVYGTFQNGRVEEYFESEALTATEMRDPQVSAWIGMRMAELHCVDLSNVDLEHGAEPEGVRRNVRKWLEPAQEVVRLAKEQGYTDVEGLDLARFAEEWERYWAWLTRWESKHGESPRVFSHNDTQYGNLLRLEHLKRGRPAHHKIIVVDFEYASPNAAAFDIANHFHEWTADYHSEAPHELRADKYPGLSARRNFYVAYLTQARAGPPESKASVSRSSSVESVESVTPPAPHLAPTDAELDALDGAVRAWSAASDGMWAVWGLVQAREDVLSGSRRPEFDYVGYARCRMGRFRRALGEIEL